MVDSADSASAAPEAAAAPASAPPSSASPSSRAEYEFDDKQNLVIGATANRARIFGILCSITGVVQLLAAVLGLAGVLDPGMAVFMIPGGIFNLVLGMFFARVGTSLSQVVMTQGEDITLMLGALQNLGKAFLIQIVASIIVLVWVVLTMVTFIIVSGVVARMVG